MIDFHTHILPRMDDGSKDTQMSLQMLRMEREQGIDTVVLTPHFYAGENDPKHFLERRAASWKRLQEELADFPDPPRFLLGAEVQYFEAIGFVKDLSPLCIEGTNVLLLEMPFSRWDANTIRTVLELNSRHQIVLAHIERYLAEQKASVWETLREDGVLMQVNTTFFDGWLRRRRAMAMLNKEQFQLIGSDCHNLTIRKPNWNLVPEEALQAADAAARSLLFPE